MIFIVLSLLFSRYEESEKRGRGDAVRVSGRRQGRMDDNVHRERR
jgi:hypothetical protein